MNNKVLFMIIDSKVLYLSNSNMDHREWYNSLQLDSSLFDNIIRGFILDGKIVFYKGFFNYDDEVIKAAEKYSSDIKTFLNNQSLEVYCGVLPGKPGQKWEPILKIDNSKVVNDRFSNDTNMSKDKIKKETKELESLIDFKNDYNDPKVLKKAKISTIIILIINLVLKIVLYSVGFMNISNTIDNVLVLIQFLLLGITLYSYIINLKCGKFFGLISSIFIVFSLDFIGIIVGILYFLYTIDQSILDKPINVIKSKFTK